jgi:hypothetical protein
MRRRCATPDWDHVTPRRCEAPLCGSSAVLERKGGALQQPACHVGYLQHHVSRPICGTCASIGLVSGESLKEIGERLAYSSITITVNF